MIKNPVDILFKVSILQIDFNGFNIEGDGSWIIVEPGLIPSFSFELAFDSFELSFSSIRLYKIKLIIYLI